MDLNRIVVTGDRIYINRDGYLYQSPVTTDNIAWLERSRKIERAPERQRKFIKKTARRLNVENIEDQVEFFECEESELYEGLKVERGGGKIFILKYGCCIKKFDKSEDMEAMNFVRRNEGKPLKRIAKNEDLDLP